MPLRAESGGEATVEKLHEQRHRRHRILARELVNHVTNARHAVSGDRFSHRDVEDTRNANLAAACDGNVSRCREGGGPDTGVLGLGQLHQAVKDLCRRPFPEPCRRCDHADQVHETTMIVLLLQTSIEPGLLRSCLKAKLN